MLERLPANLAIVTKSRGAPDSLPGRAGPLRKFYLLLPGSSALFSEIYPSSHNSTIFSSDDTCFGRIRDCSTAFSVSTVLCKVPLLPTTSDLKQILSPYQHQYWPAARMSLMTQGLLYSTNSTLGSGEPEFHLSFWNPVPLALRLPLPQSSDRVSSVVTSPHGKDSRASASPTSRSVP